MWPWFIPMTPNRTRGAGFALASAEAALATCAGTSDAAAIPAAAASEASSMALLALLGMDRGPGWHVESRYDPARRRVAQSLGGRHGWRVGHGLSSTRPSVRSL